MFFKELYALPDIYKRKIIPNKECPATILKDDPQNKEDQRKPY